MSAVHSVGPWVKCGGAILSAGDAIQQRVVAVVHYTDMIAPAPMVEREYNARLIAAAPDMLAALRRAVLALAFAAESSPAMRDDYNAVSEAIAKATAP